MSARSAGALSGGPCGACKFLRRKCVTGCIFAPYFGADHGATNFSAVHKVFGASNVSKLLTLIPANKRLDAVITICYEAQARLRDPIHGCVAHIFSLQQQVVSLQAEISFLRARLASLELSTPPSSSALTVPLQEPQPWPTLANPFDLAKLFEAPVNHPQCQAAQQQPVRPVGLSDGRDDLRLLARELVDGQKSAASLPPAHAAKR